MIVNIYENGKKKSEKISKFTVDTVKKYIVDNYMEYIQIKNRVLLENKIKDYIYKNSDMESLKIEELTKATINEIFGYAILQKYIDDVKITDIRAVSFNNIYIKKSGKWIKADESFKDDNDFVEYIRYTILKNNAMINFETPLVITSDKKFNLRIEAGISPVNTLSSSLVIRIHRNNLDISLEKLCFEDNMFETKQYLDLLNMIKEQKNIIIAGKGGSGKTTLLRAMIDKIPNESAITVNEETTELYIKNKNIIQREIIENREQGKKISLENLMKHSLVMSNDYIIIGELKGAEASLFFDSISTGHIGMTTVHSNGVYNTIDRLTTLVKRDQKSVAYKESFVSGMLASSIDYIIFLKDYKIRQIAKVIYDRKNEKVELELV
ncbi:MAG: ATPase, T2SS/T4P/T4SS family [Clostridia bacterium]